MLLLSNFYYSTHFFDFEKSVIINQTHIYKTKRLAGASLLILANKQDLPGALTSDQIRLVRFFFFLNVRFFLMGVYFI